MIAPDSVTTFAEHLMENTWTLYLEAAPWIMVGLLSAGVIRAWVPQQRLAHWLGGNGPWPVTKAALIGAPLPLCSCGVIPVALGLHRTGASRGSTLAFLIATPETGVDSVAASYALLGPFLTLVRPLAAILSGILTGLMASLIPPAVTPASTALDTDSPCGTACGGLEERTRSSHQTAACNTERGCGGATAIVETHKGMQWWPRTWSGIRYAITELLDDFSLWLFIGLAVAGMTMTLVPPTALAAYASGLSAMLFMLVVGIPFYVCATESTPIATAMLLAGVSPGAVLVFLLAGPATNLGTVGALRQEFGTRFMVIYVVGISLCAVGFGLLTNYAVASLGINITAQLHAGQELLPEWVKYGSALTLTVLALRPLRKRVLGSPVMPVRIDNEKT